MARITNVTISIETRNAAFSAEGLDLDIQSQDDADWYVMQEVTRIVRSTFTSEVPLYPGDSDKVLRDVNGNAVGKITFTREGE